MHTKQFIFALALTMGVFVGLSFSAFSQKSDAILGEWINAEQNARFEIYKSESRYFGKILWGTGSDPKDVKNPDKSLRNRDLVGLTILNDFVYEGGNSWAEGTIYDPKDGKTYSCKLTLTAPNKLDVRGFVGFSLFGRTETWTKIN